MYALQNDSIIADIAKNCGIDWKKAKQLINYNGLPIKRGIELNKDYRGKVFAVGSKFIAPDGKEYRRITFKTFKDGDYSETFNEWNETQDERDREKNTNKKPAYKPSKQPPTRTIDSDTPTAKPKTEWRVKAFNEAAAAFEQASGNVAEHQYIIDKGVNTDGLDIRRGIGKHGDCVMVAMRNMDGGIVGYQQIYADKIPNKETNKLFFIKNEGDKKGSFIVIGDADKIKDGAIFCEGLATGLSIYHADGDGKTTLHNTEKLPVIVCLDAGNLLPVIEQFKTSCDDIKIHADNDTGKAHGNTGIFCALECAKKLSIEFITVPVSTNEKAVDFNDTLNFEVLKIARKPLDYVLQLIKVAPTCHLNRLGTRLALIIANDVPRYYSVMAAVDFVYSQLAKRGNDGAKVKALAIITNHIKKRIEALKIRNKITSKLGIIIHKLHNLDKLPESERNIQIAKHICENGGGIWLDNRSLGQGKTKLLERLRILLDEQSIAYVCHRVSLTKDAAGRLGLTSYHDADPAEAPKHLAVCVNSATKYRLASYQILFIDEFRQTLEHILNGTVDNRKECLATLIYALERADLVVCSDADLNNMCVRLLKKHGGGKSINLIETTPNPNPKTIHLLPDHDATYQAIADEISGGGFPFIACTSKTEAVKLYTFLNEQGLDGGLLIHAKNRGDDQQAEFLADPNGALFNPATGENDRYNYVIHSPTIGSGVSIETQHFTTNYLLHAGNLPSNEALQMTARNRCANDIYVSFSPQKIYDRVTDLELLQQGEKLKNDRLPDLLTPKKGGSYEFTELATLRIESKRAINEDLNDFANNFLLLAELNGYAINRDKSESAPEANTQGLAKRVKLQTVSDIFTTDIITPETAKTLENKQARTQVDSDQLDRHKTTVMCGIADIAHDDVKNFVEGASKQLTNYETAYASIHDCRKFDAENAITENKASSKVSIHELFNITIKPILDKGIIIDKVTAAAFCEVLKDNGAELAANGLGNYDKTKFTRPIATLGNFIKRYGYELEQVSRTHSGDKTFKVVAIEYIERYAEQRKKTQ